MDAILALANDADYFVEPRVTGVVYFKRALSAKTQLVNGKNDGVENGLVDRIEGAIDEYIFAPNIRLGHKSVC